MTGFYVASVVSRYWDQFLALPWPDRLAYKLVSYVPGQVTVNFICSLTRGLDNLFVEVFLQLICIVAYFNWN